MKKPFQVGDKIKVFATLNGHIAETPGEIVRFRPDGMLYVNLRGRQGEIVAQAAPFSPFVLSVHKENT